MLEFFTNIHLWDIGPFWSSFLGSLLAGFLLISSAPFWWNHIRSLIDKNKYSIRKFFPFVIILLLIFIVILFSFLYDSPRLISVPPNDLSDEEIRRTEIECELEAVSVYPIYTTTFRRRIYEQASEREKYRRRCLEREGFTWKIDDDNSQ